MKIPAFPDTEHPKQNAWVPFLSEKIGQPDENLFLIGHSVGCVTIMRYLETLQKNQRVGGVVFVAGFTEDLGYDEIKNFFETPIDFVNIKSKSKNGFVAIHSDNDPHVDLKYAGIFKEKLGAEVIIKHKMGHFSGAIEGEKPCLELPEVIQTIEDLSK